MTGNELRKLVKGKLYTLCQYVYYYLADKDAMYPHIVLTLSRASNYDIARDDVTIDVEIYAKGANAEAEAQDLADAVEAMFNALNDPQEQLLPTFFVESIKQVPESDKSIRHKTVEITAQNYERR